MKPAASVAEVRSTTTARVPADGDAPPSVEPSAHPYGLCTPRRRSAVITIACLALGVLVLTPTSALARNIHVFSSAFGSEGPESGKFKAPVGVAVNEVTLGMVGDVYVVDGGNNRVEIFSSTGTFVSEFNGAAALTGPFASPEWIAVDNSSNPLDPSAGDVYVADNGHRVIDKFSPAGVYVGQITTGAGGQSIGELLGLAVGPSGLVWFSQSSGELDSYSNALNNAFLASYGAPFGLFQGLAVDAEGNLFVAKGSCGVAKLSSEGQVLTEHFDSECSRAVAVDRETSAVYVDHGGTEIAAFSPSGAPLEQFGSGHLAESEAIAVNAATGTVYATDKSGNDVDSFNQILVPDVSTGEATGVLTEGSATLHGVVNPDGVSVTACRFEYGATTSYGATAECSPSPGSGSAAVAVSAALTSLTSDSVYHYRLVAANASGENAGTDRTFTAPARPSLANEAVSHVTATAATVGWQLTPGGSPTTYSLEYGPTSAYGLTTPTATAGAGIAPLGAQESLSGLTPATEYHVRVAAQNALGAVHGPDLHFTTAASGGPSTSALPDDRAYELVSPANPGDGEAYIPESGHAWTERSHGEPSALAVRAAADGNAVAYPALPTATEGNGSFGSGLGNQFLATRHAGGWLALDVMPPTAEFEVYQGFSADLAQSFLTHFQEPQLAPDAPAHCTDLYSRATVDGSFHALFTTTRTPGCGSPRFSGVAADGHSTIFETEAALTPEAVAGSEERFHRTDNLYDSVGGHVFLVNVLPNGHPDVNAAFGGDSAPGEEGGEEYKEERPGYHHFGQAISADGTRIVWTDLNTGVLYLRENPASPAGATVQVDSAVGGGGQFRGASADGSEIFFMKSAHLYQYTTATASTTDLTPGGAVLGVSGVSNDGTHVYFVASAVLASNRNSSGALAVEGEPNLYVYSAGATSFIATLATFDNEMSGPGNSGEGYWGDWRPGLKVRTAEVSSDGLHLVFTSIRSLTGYDNKNPHCTWGGANSSCTEVFTYAADTQQLTCASCNPTGEPPVSPEGESGGSGGAFLPTVDVFASGTYQLRWISSDGSRVFFDSQEPLVPQDTNGVQDVYEWERAGAGTCHLPSGCVFLISSSLSNEEAYFLDASESGGDVFFTSRAQLVPQDHNEVIHVYDARVDGGFPTASTECTGAGCQGAPPTSPGFATPPTTTFQGTGNFTPSGQPQVLSQAKRLAAALKACKKMRRKRRGACERLARRRYGSTAAYRTPRAHHVRRAAK
jgi:hypothetical protein